MNQLARRSSPNAARPASVYDKGNRFNCDMSHWSANAACHTGKEHRGRPDGPLRHFEDDPES